ncbi:hypothetical protein GX50_03781 [[Emmonsia] crescens]|uniref:Uncharacterized protein n=1 Tax=[Emmonsia] crescens TaxID=73230 RepID=A0A2B7ZAE2_9EURO|nr:hypothetical protein GX50_03781 [Emmonsia crescens]
MTGSRLSDDWDIYIWQIVILWFSVLKLTHLLKVKVTIANSYLKQAPEALTRRTNPYPKSQITTEVKPTNRREPYLSQTQIQCVPAAPAPALVQAPAPAPTRTPTLRPAPAPVPGLIRVPVTVIGPALGPVLGPALDPATAITSLTPPEPYASTPFLLFCVGAALR